MFKKLKEISEKSSIIVKSTFGDLFQTESYKEQIRANKQTLNDFFATEANSNLSLEEGFKKMMNLNQHWSAEKKYLMESIYKTESAAIREYQIKINKNKIDLNKEREKLMRNGEVIPEIF